MANGVLIGALEFYGDATKYSGDPGTVTNPYCISDIKDLKACGKLTTISNYILTDDINFREYNRICDGNFYIPIDEYFDFNGFAFWNLNIRCMDTDNYESYYNVFNFNCRDISKDRYIKKCKLVNFIYNNNYSCILFLFDYKSSTIENSSVYFDDADISMHIIQHIQFYTKYAPLICVDWGSDETDEKLFLRNSTIKLSGREEVNQGNYESMVSELFKNYYDGVYIYMYDCTIIFNDYKIVIMQHPTNSYQTQSFMPYASFTDSVIITGSVIFELSDKYASSSSNASFLFLDYSPHDNVNTLIDCNFTFVNNNKEKYPNFYISISDSGQTTPLFINKDKFEENVRIAESDTFYLLNTEQLKNSDYLIGMGLMIDNEGELP
jgi:hypothetical protein